MLMSKQILRFKPVLTHLNHIFTPSVCNFFCPIQVFYCSRLLKNLENFRVIFQHLYYTFIKFFNANIIQTSFILKKFKSEIFV